MSVALQGPMARTAARGRSRQYPEALTACYTQHSADLVGYLVTLVGDVGMAQDFAQEAFVELFARWRTVAHPRAYVYMTATNLARAHWRRREREGRAFAMIDAMRRETAVEHDPWLWDLVARMPDRLRVPVLLHYYADLPVHEVAEQLRLPDGTVKRRLHEARSMLLDIVKESRA